MTSPRTFAVTVRAAEQRDVPRLVVLAEQLGYAATELDVTRRLAELAEEPDVNASFVACDAQDRAIGWIHVQRSRALLFDPYAEIIALVVAADVRSAGVGARLLAHAEAWARERGLTTVRLRSRTTRERAHAFYLRHGYVITKTQAAFEKRLAR